MFKHTPLAREPFEIRLFKIVAAFEKTSKLRLVLSTHTLHDAGRFVALSYTWDKPSSQCPSSWDDENYKEEVFIDGKTSWLRPNLRSLLLELRESKDKHMYFFADAICIDQDNESEKASQIGHMGDIYGCACYTLIWLGPESQHNPAPEIIERFAKAWCSRDPERQHTGPGNATIGEYIAALQNDIRSVLHLDTLVDFLSRPYWSRVWVVQEILRSREIFVLNNRHYVDWKSLTATIRLLAHHCAVLPFIMPRTELDLTHEQLLLEPFIKIANSSTGFGRIHAIYAVYSWHPERQTLADILWYLQPLHSKINKDKAYAAMGLVQSHDRLAVDYGKSDREVFRDVVVLCISSTGSLRVLEACNYPRTGLPSWVPDWSHEGDFAQQIPLSIFRDKRPHAGTRQPVCVRYDQQRSMLAVVGKKMQVVTRIHLDCDATFWERGCIAYDGLDAETNMHVLHIHQMDQPLGETVSTQNCFIADTCYVNSREPRYRAYFRTLCHDTVTDFNPNEEPDYSWFGLEDRKAMFHGFHLEKKLIETEDGYYAFVPRSTCVGDWVILFQGAMSPYVLRPAGKAFHLMGSCYVHGAMDGSVWRSIPDDRLQYFELV